MPRANRHHYYHRDPNLTAYDTAALTVACGYCAAPAGQPCQKLRSPTTPTYLPHKRRVKEAWKRPSTIRA